MGKNLIQTIFMCRSKKIEKGEVLNIVDDQYRTQLLPTYQLNF